jgi:hypothetical protein
MYVYLCIARTTTNLKAYEYTELPVTISQEPHFAVPTVSVVLHTNKLLPEHL